MTTVWILWVWITVTVQVPCPMHPMIPRNGPELLCDEKQEQWRYKALYDSSSVLTPRKACEAALMTLPSPLLREGKLHAQCLPLGLDPERLAPE